MNISTKELPIGEMPTSIEIDSVPMSRIRDSKDISNARNEMITSLEYQSPRERSRPFTIDDARTILNKLTSCQSSNLYSRLMGKTLSKEVYKQIKSETFSDENIELWNKIHNTASKYFSKEDSQIRFKNESWIYQISGETKQASIRIYIKPQLKEVFSVWDDIRLLLSKNKEIERSGFSSKISNLNSYSPKDFFSNCQQDDRMLFYFPKEIEDIGIKIITDYILNNKDKFETCFSLATPLLDNKGNNLDCAFAADELIDLPKDENTLNSFYGYNILPKVLQNYAILNGMNPSYYDLIESISQNPELKKGLAEYMVVELPRLTEQYGFTVDSTSFKRNKTANAELN
jgi:hypothetical protein